MPPQSEPRRSYLPALTSLRFLAAFHVVLYHYFPITALYHYVAQTRDGSISNLLLEGLVRLIGVGYIEVALFFILSGFILAYTYLNHTSTRKHTTGDFALSRFARIYPVYVCAWAFAGMYAIAMMVTDKGQVHTSIGQLAMHALVSLFCVQSWSGKISAHAWNGPGWSISAELAFYALFAALFLGRLASWGTRSLRFLVSITIFALLVKITGTIAYFAFHPDGLTFTDTLASLQNGGHWEKTAWQNWLTYCPFFRVGEFLLGVTLARVYMVQRDRLDSRGSKGGIARLPVVPMLFAYAACGIVSGIYLPPLVAGIALLPIQAMIIYRLAFPVTAWTGLTTAPMILLGEASYALYLFHDPLLSWTESVFKLATHAAAGTFAVHLSIRIPCLVAAVVVSILVYRFIEVPARREVRARFGRYFTTKHQHVPSPIEAAIAVGQD